MMTCVKVGSGGNLSLSREYSKKLVWPLFYSWCNFPLKLTNDVSVHLSFVLLVIVCVCSMSHYEVNTMYYTIVYYTIYLYVSSYFYLSIHLSIYLYVNTHI